MLISNFDGGSALTNETGVTAEAHTRLAVIAPTAVAAAGTVFAYSLSGWITRTKGALPEQILIPLILSMVSMVFLFGAILAAHQFFTILRIMVVGGSVGNADPRYSLLRFLQLSPMPLT